MSDQVNKSCNQMFHLSKAAVCILEEIQMKFFCVLAAGPSFGFPILAFYVAEGDRGEKVVDHSLCRRGGGEWALPRQAAVSPSGSAEVEGVFCPALYLICPSPSHRHRRSARRAGDQFESAMKRWRQRFSGQSARVKYNSDACLGFRFTMLYLMRMFWEDLV